MNTIYLQCVICGGHHYVKVPEYNVELWLSGEKTIQEALPMLSPEEREQLLSDICPSCQKKIFD